MAREATMKLSRTLKNIAFLIMTLLLMNHLSANTTSTEILSYYSDDYHEAREKFLSAAQMNGGRIKSHQCPATGPHGEPLYIDVAYFGATEPEAAIVLSSGTHGIEGFAGSAIQTGLLHQGLTKTLLPHIGLVMVHAVNPYGFAHLRRTNEDNIDLNRNFIDHTKPHPKNKAYEKLADAITPQSLDFSHDTKSLIKLMWYRLRYGSASLRSAVSSGQYTHQNGLFYGGLTPAWSNTIFRQITHQSLQDVKRIVLIDVHTGLGDYGNAEVIMNVPATSPAYHRARKMWGDIVTTTVTGESVSAHLSGTLKLAFEKMLPSAEVTAVGLEFGTSSRRKVLRALRSENWLHHHGGSKHPDTQKIKSALIKAFYPNDEAWKLDVWKQGRQVVEKSLAPESN